MMRGDRESIDKWANRGMWDLEDDPDAYLPTVERIAALCREIQAGWTEEERLIRLGRIVPAREPIHDRETGDVRLRQKRGPKPAGTPKKKRVSLREKAFIR